MRLHAIADCCRLTSLADGSGPWVIHIEPDEVQLLFDGVHHVIVLPKNAEYIRHLGDGAWEIINAEAEGRWRIQWTQFAGMYRATSGYVWAIPDVVGVRDSDIASIVRAGNTHWLTLVDGYAPGQRGEWGKGPITSERHHVPSQPLSPVPDELAKLFREVLAHPAPVLMWKEAP